MCKIFDAYLYKFICSTKSHPRLLFHLAIGFVSLGLIILLQFRYCFFYQYGFLYFFRNSNAVERNEYSVIEKKFRSLFIRVEEGQPHLNWIKNSFSYFIIKDKRIAVAHTPQLCEVLLRTKHSRYGFAFSFKVERERKNNHELQKLFKNQPRYQMCEII